MQAAASAAPYLLAFSAASFIYIALSDLIPSHRMQTSLESAIRQLGLILAGIGTVVAAQHLLQD
jgi:zinc and cadmium transporter